MTKDCSADISNDTFVTTDMSKQDLKDSEKLGMSIAESNETCIISDISAHDINRTNLTSYNNLCAVDDTHDVTNPLTEKEKGKKEIPNSAQIKRKGKVLLKKFLIFLFSHVGLTCLVIGYSILGAIIFQSLEQGNEKQSRLITTNLRKETLNELWNATYRFNILEKPNWTGQVEHTLRLFEKQIYVATKELGWDGISDEAVGELHWSFTGSLLYSVTVITTIGYGHITPKTAWGRIVTMIYAFFGIPLTLLCLANIGSLLGKGFQIFYNRIPVVRNKRNFGIGHALPLPQTTIRHEKVKGEDGTIIEENKLIVYIPTRTLPPPQHVPIIVCSLLVITYTLIGTLLFHLWETSWDILTSAYFCFITLSTIGFGDVVPGHSLDSWQSQPKQFICAIYLLFGLTLLAMCFDLLQEQVRTFARWFGECLGIVEVEDDEENEEDTEHNMN
ncbi:TWiK family of potassium channels protein 18-like [Mytilus californianus]|uniref:TWiK family of potassium channels protein 18-like n=1 Tax=Mytilus californianus TaxID=6549 RepID=UPI0022452940|nr:TWiK family of potassium channels protein 18-like [Mytilus californianus]